MNYSKVLLASLVAMALSACGKAVEIEDATKISKAAVKVEKFKGSKFAPSQDVMNRTAAMAFWESAGNTIVTPGEACSRAYRGRENTPECKAQIEDVLSRSTFTPRECRKGDERRGYDNFLVNPVSCDGDIDTPHASAKVLMVFHETTGEIKAWSDGMVSGTLVKR